MSYSGIGHAQKNERLRRSQEVFDRFEAEEDREAVFLRKGERMGVLHIKETTMSWDVFRDLQMSQHLDWEHPDCYPQFSRNRQNLSPLAFVSMLVADGWESADE